MELQSLISDVGGAAVVVLFVASIVFPIALASVRAAEEWLALGHASLVQPLGRAFFGRPAPAKPEDRRRYKRFRTHLEGTVYCHPRAKDARACEILDLSANGARIRTDLPLVCGRRLNLAMERFGIFRVHMVWRRGSEVGLQFAAEPRKVVTMMRGFLPRKEAAA